MIAICPTCHDDVHHGALKIDDAKLYTWKNIRRTSNEHRDHIYVEPAHQPKILLGSIAIQSENSEQIVFQLSNENRFTFRVAEEDILLVDSRIKRLDGREVLRVAYNHVRTRKDANVLFDRRPGKMVISVPATESYIPAWIIEKMRSYEPNFASSGRVIALGLEVEAPGLLRVQGLWLAPEGSFIATLKSFSMVRQSLPRPISLVGEGAQSTLIFAGPVTSAMFGFR
jgi:hypothetical protein